MAIAEKGATRGHSVTGDTSGFIALYQRHVDTVYRVCYTYLHNAADTEDAVQNVFIKLLNAPRDFESDEHEKAWLIRVASNHCKDVLKSAWNRRTGFENIPEPLTEDAAPDETLEEVLKLPENQRICVYLYYYEGYSTAEIANMIDRPNSTVRNYLSDARKELGKRLKGSFDE
ncbi:MAG: RNA polymerase sigma factor [Coriobacteriia bacterium]|nr:RNA polymerase sigma factor [Coriobacteriia bacterium]